MKKGAFVFFSVFFIFCVYFLQMISPVIYSGNNVVPDSVIKNIVVTGRRGAAGLAPKNTTRAVKEGIGTGAPRIEIDIRQTKSKVTVCLLNPTIDCTTKCSFSESIIIKGLIHLEIDGIINVYPNFVN